MSSSLPRTQCRFAVCPPIRSYLSPKGPATLTRVQSALEIKAVSEASRRFQLGQQLRRLPEQLPVSSAGSTDTPVHDRANGPLPCDPLTRHQTRRPLRSPVLPPQPVFCLSWIASTTLHSPDFTSRGPTTSSSPATTGAAAGSVGLSSRPQTSHAHAVGAATTAFRLLPPATG